MTPTIRIDHEVYEALKSEAEPFIDTPNSVLRRLLGLSGTADRGGGLADVSEDGAELGASTETPPRLTARTKGRARQSSSLRRRTHRGRTRKRAPKGTLLPESEYEVPILQILAEHDGRAPSRELIDALEQRIGERLTELDRQRNSSGQTRWRNRAQFVRLRLVESGDMVRDSPRGVWEISEQGRRRLKGQ